jgi:Mn-dependent DtxR family transcriptional regulator
MVEALSILVGGKKIEILKYIINHLDQEHIFYGSYQDIMDDIGVSKPTVVNMFKQLIQAGVLEKIKNKVYRFQNTKFIKDEK